MIPVSDRWLNEIRQDHTEYTRVELWSAANGEKIKDLDVDADNSDLTCDSTAQVMRYCNIALADGTVPGLVPDELWPIGPELRIFSGMEYSDDTTEEIPQGRFRLSKPHSEVSGDSPASTKLTGYDYSYVFSRNRFTQPYGIANNINVIAAIQAVALDRFPGVKFRTTSSTVILPQTTLQHGGESDPWNDLGDLADAASLEVFFDVEGYLVVRPIVDPATDTPVFDYIDDEFSIVTDMQRDIDEERAYSGVVLSGSHPDANPIYVEAWDYDPNSPTYVSTYGKVPYFIDAQFITNAQASQPGVFAASKLSQVRGIIAQVNFNSVANLAHEQNDVINLRSLELNVNQTAVIKGFTRSLAPGAPLKVTCQQIRTVSLDG